MGYKMLNGLRKGSSKNLMIGPGILTKHFNLQTYDPTDMATWGEMLGASKGGNQFQADTEWHDVEVDGALGKVTGMRWLVKAEAKLSTTLVEITRENLLMKLSVFDIKTHNEQYDIISHNGSVAPVGTTNLALFATISSKELPIVIVLENANCTDSLDLPLGNGKEDVTLKAEFEAMYSEEQPTRIPFYILYPKGGSDVVAPVATPAPGEYATAQSVELVSAAGTEIYYTLDGTYPTPLNGIKYTTPINVAQTTTIKAIASKDFDTSEPITLVYTITP